MYWFYNDIFFYLDAIKNLTSFQVCLMLLNVLLNWYVQNKIFQFLL